MTYPETLDYLFHQLPMYQRVGAKAFKKDLNNIIALCESLDHPEKRFRSIHLAGTNGKGSTAHLLASVLQEAGFKTGLYTSPHLEDYRERVRINGQMIPKETVVQFVEQHQAAFEQIKPSFFEWSVALAFQYFALEEVDVAVIETGLGGRLDSTNVVTPEMSIITNIGWDHMAFLGDTLPLIAGEKAGIIKAGVPVVIGERQPEVQHVFEEKAAAMNAPISWAAEVELTYPVGLAGAHQRKNAQSVVEAVCVLREKDWVISEDALRNGLSNVVPNTGIRGRWEVLDQNPLVVADTGHNQEGIEAVLHQIQQTPHQRLHWVFGMVFDKEASKILNMLPKNANYYLCAAQVPRALPAAELGQLFQETDLAHTTHTSISEALTAARSAAQPDDLILIGGSTFVVAEALGLFN